jgi:hypothetical protein
LLLRSSTLMFHTNGEWLLKPRAMGRGLVSRHRLENDRATAVNDDADMIVLCMFHDGVSLSVWQVRSENTVYEFFLHLLGSFFVSCIVSSVVSVPHFFRYQSN